MRKTVRFNYYTGIYQKLFDNPVLAGTWDGAGRYSEQWSEVAMRNITGPDGCPAFTATAEIENEDPQQVFYWGVKLDGPAGKQLWAIMTEENDPAASGRRRMFTLDGSEPQEQVYYLSVGFMCNPTATKPQFHGKEAPCRRAGFAPKSPPSPASFLPVAPGTGHGCMRR